MILNVENSEDHTHKQDCYKNEFNKVAAYKVNMQNSAVFPAMNNAKRK